MEILRATRSLCPVCLKLIPAEITERDSKVYIQKKCEEHGEFEDLYYGDVELYDRVMKDFHTGHGVANPLSEYHGACARDCGLCNNHKSSPIIGIIDVTNRCNLDCTVCFAGCNASRSYYEPSMDEISTMLDNLRNADPPCPIVLFSGGEPTIRDDFLDICRLAHSKGFKFIIVATNGKKIAAEPEYHNALGDAYVDVIYLQFDGVTPEPYKKLRGKDILPIKLKAIENINNSPNKFPIVVLVPTLAKDVNDDQIGDIVRFAASNVKSIRGVLFQPIGFVGTIKNDELRKKRFTNSDGINSLAEQSGRAIERDDFYSVIWIKNFIDAYKRVNPSDEIFELSIHPACFAVSYLIKNKGQLIPLSKILNLEELNNFAKSIKTGTKTEVAKNLAIFIPKIVKLKSLSIVPKLIQILKDTFNKGSIEAISKFHSENVILVGFEHTTDPHNYDTEKVERCCIHYATPNNKIIPFCSYNLLHRKKIEKEFSRTFGENLGLD